MTMRILTGQRYNLLERGIVTVPTSHAQLTKDRLFDGRPSRAYREAAAGPTEFFKVDGNLLTDGLTKNYGDFETWFGGLPQGWAEINTGTGDVVEEAVIVNSGAKSAKLAGGTGSASIWIDVVVKSGEIINISSALHGAAGGGGSGALLRVYNPLTHHYLDSGGAWVSTLSNYRTQTADAWAVTTAAVTVESYAVCQSDLVTLRISAVGTLQTVYVDDIYVWPRVNFLSVHGHNIDPDATGTANFAFRSSTDNFSSSTVEGSPAILRPSFYSLLSAGNQDRRYWALFISPQNSVPIEIGEMVIGYAQTPLQQHEDPVESDSFWDRQASVTPGGERHVHKRSKWQIRRKVFHYNLWSQAAYDNARELFHLRPEGDTYPVVIVPETTRSEVIHGRLRSNLQDSLIVVDYYTDVAVELEESPFASTAF